MNTSEIIDTTETSNVSKRQEREGQIEEAKEVVHAEIGITPIEKSTSIDHNNVDENMVQISSTITRMSRDCSSIRLAYDAIYHVKGIKTVLTGMGTQIESKNMHNILQAVEAAHQALKNAGIKRIITSIHIDERLDKVSTLEDKEDSVKKRLLITS